MNDITLIREYGPDAPALSPAALADARARLMAEATAAPRPRPGLLVRVGDVTGRLRGRARLLVAAGAAIAAVAAAVAVLAPAPQPPSRPSAGVSLVAFSTPVFPIALRPTPPGLSAPSFTGQAGTWTAVYQSTDEGNDVYLTVHPANAELGIPCTATIIAGKPGDLCTWAPTSGGETSVTLTWERIPGQWVAVTGNGRYATESGVRTLAAAIVDEPQRVPLQLHLAPAGWTLDAFKDDSIVTLRDAADPRNSLSVQAVPRMDPDVFHNTQGARRASTVQINGRAGQLILTEDEWFLQAPLPDGTAFNLQTPLLLTREQVIAIGGQVSRS